ncbi:MAG: hypothetical protein WC788_09430 [Candidatus Paceibacterota bacterium]|jgi:hypothetical protein
MNLSRNSIINIYIRKITDKPPMGGLILPLSGVRFLPLFIFCFLRYKYIAAKNLMISNIENSIKIHGIYPTIISPKLVGGGAFGNDLGGSSSKLHKGICVALAVNALDTKTIATQ